MCDLFEQRFRNDTQMWSFGLSDSVLEQIQTILKKPVGHIEAPISISLEIADEMLSDAKAAATKINTHMMRLKPEFYYFLEGKASVGLRLRQRKNSASGQKVGWPVALPASGLLNSFFLELHCDDMDIIR